MMTAGLEANTTEVLYGGNKAMGILWLVGGMLF